MVWLFANICSRTYLNSRSALGSLDSCVVSQLIGESYGSGWGFAGRGFFMLCRIRRCLTSAQGAQPKIRIFFDALPSCLFLNKFQGSCSSWEVRLNGRDLQLGVFEIFNGSFIVCLNTSSCCSSKGDVLRSTLTLVISLHFYSTSFFLGMLPEGIVLFLTGVTLLSVLFSRLCRLTLVCSLFIGEVVLV